MMLPRQLRSPERRTGLVVLFAGCLGLSALLVGGGLIGPVTSALRAADPLEDYKLAVGLYNRGKWKLAAESFEAFIKTAGTHPNVEKARYYLGLTYFNAENYKLSRETLRAFLKDFPKSPRVTEAYYWAGYSSYLLEDYEAAETELGQFVAGSPDDPLLERAWPMLGECALRKKQYEVAAALFEKSVQKHPQGALVEDAKFGWARSLEALKKPEQAIKLYEALAADATGARAAEAQLNIGIRHYDEGRFKESAAAFELVETKFGSSPLVSLAQLNRGFSFYQLQDFAKAAVEFEKSAKDPKHTAEGRLWMGFSLKAKLDLPAAAKVFQAGYEQFKADPAGERYLFHWADCLQRDGKLAEALPLHKQLVQEYPKGSLAETSQLAAATCSYQLGQFDEADKLIAAANELFPQGRLKDRFAILKARIAGERNDWPAAILAVQPVVQQAADPVVKTEAVYFLASAQQRLGQHAQVLTVTEPFMAQLDSNPALKDFAGLRVLRAASALALGNAARETPQGQKDFWNLANQWSEEYLTRQSAGDLIPAALRVKAVSSAALGDKAKSDAALVQLKQKQPMGEELDRTLYELGQLAFGRGEFAVSEPLFKELASRPKENRFRGPGLLERGWSLHKLQKYPDAAQSFAQFAAEYPKDPLAAEAACMQATAVQDAGQIAQAIPLFQAVFDKYGESEQAYVAGLQVARLQSRQKKLTEADAAYQALTTRFPKRPELDRVLDEWATVHYDATNFKRADEIFRDLATRFPNSDLADNAQLVLAESLLVNGQLDPARAAFETLVKSPKSDATVKERSLYQLVLIELERKDWARVQQAAAALIAEFPKGTYRHDAEFHTGEALYEQTKYEPALAQLEALRAQMGQPGIKEAEWFPTLWVLAVESAFRLKKYPVVDQWAAESRKQSPPLKLQYQIDEVQARSLKARAEFAQARELFQKVVDDPNGRLTETAARAQFEMAESYLFEKNYNSALKAYLKVEIRYKFPKWQGLALYQVGQCHEALGEWSEAARSYQSLLESYADHDMAGKAKERLEFARKKQANPAG